MTSSEKRIELAKYRIKQAAESLEEAEFLLSGQKSPRSIINRAYYAMFYSVLALLVYESYSSSKHTGVIGYFNKRYIKEKIFPEDLGRSINSAFELRQRGDYREYFELSYETVEPYIDKARTFLAAIRDYLSQKQ